MSTTGAVFKVSEVQERFMANSKKVCCALVDLVKAYDISTTENGSDYCPL
jgi:hypothetical protein